MDNHAHSVDVKHAGRGRIKVLANRDGMKCWQLNRASKVRASNAATTDQVAVLIAFSNLEFRGDSDLGWGFFTL